LKKPPFKGAIAYSFTFFWNYLLDILLLFLEICCYRVLQKLQWSWSTTIFRRKGVIMRFLGVVTVIALVCSGCTVSHRSEVIDTDKLGGFASGTYDSKSHGPVGKLTAGGSGFGAAAVSSGFGVGWISVETGPPLSGAYDFARAIAMINYSKKLKSIKYDEFGGVIDYEFEAQPVSYVKTTPYMKTTPLEPGTKLKRRSSFGHQPVE
jgi:hypothetical protein